MLWNRKINIFRFLTDSILGLYNLMISFDFVCHYLLVASSFKCHSTFWKYKHIYLKKNCKKIGVFLSLSLHFWYAIVATVLNYYSRNF